MGPRWKGKGSEAKALENPMSTTISDLQSSLIKHKSSGILLSASSTCTVLLISTNPHQTHLLNQSYFGVDKYKQQRFELTSEEAFHLSFSLKCINIVNSDGIIKTDNELWNHMTFRKKHFSYFYKAYSHLRDKNWVVTSGGQYGVDFVAYCHHPSLVHSEYGVLVLFSENGNENDRLRVWSDYQSTLRVLDGVAKTLLILYVKNENGGNVGVDSPSCLDDYIVEEQTITRWGPRMRREDHSDVVENTTNIRVSNELGRGNAKATKFLIKVLLGTLIAIGVFFFVVCLIFGKKLAYVITDDERVVDTVSDLSFSVLLNSIYPVLSGVAFCFYLIGIPVGALIGNMNNLQVKVKWASERLNRFYVKTSDNQEQIR